MFLKAEPQITGKIFCAMVALRIPATNLCSVTCCAFDVLFHQHIFGFRNRFNQLVAVLLGLLNQICRNVDIVILCAQVSSRQIRAFILTRSTTPLN